MIDIEATNEAQYEVKIDDFPVFKKGKFDVKLFIDGKFVDSACNCAPDAKWQGTQNDMTFTGFPSKRDGAIVLRCFVFGKAQTTGES